MSFISTPLEGDAATPGATLDANPAATPGGQSHNEAALRQLMGTRLFRLRFPDALEDSFRQGKRSESARFLQLSIYGLMGIYLLVVVPITLLSHDPDMLIWRNWVVIPIAMALAALWVATRFRAFQHYVELGVGLLLLVALFCTLAASLLLHGADFGRLSSYQVIYVLVIAFSILRLPVRQALSWSLAAFGFALLAALLQRAPIPWLDLLLYFAVPLLLCGVTGYMLEFSERRHFLQNRLLDLESRRLAQLGERAEQEAQRQQFQAEYLKEIAGNPSPAEIATRTLRYLAHPLSMAAGVIYEVGQQHQLIRLAPWSTDTKQLATPARINACHSLIGPVLEQGKPEILNELPDNYFLISCGSGDLQPGHLLLFPVMHAEQPIAVLEIARFTPFDETDTQLLESLSQHLASALLAASARARPTDMPMETAK